MKNALLHTVSCGEATPVPIEVKFTQLDGSTLPTVTLETKVYLYKADASDPEFTEKTGGWGITGYTAYPGSGTIIESGTKTANGLVINSDEQGWVGTFFLTLNEIDFSKYKKIYARITNATVWSMRSALFFCCKDKNHLHYWHGYTTDENSAWHGVLLIAPNYDDKTFEIDISSFASEVKYIGFNGYDQGSYTIREVWLE